MAVNYYNILKVNRNTTDADLTKAYRCLAKIWHPDKNPNNRRAAEAKFKQILEAYQVLSDPQKRKNYDIWGENGLNNSRVPPDPPKPNPSPRSRAGLRKAPPVERTLMCSLEDLYNGATRNLKISRKVLDDHGHQVPQEIFVEVPIPPGFTKDMCIILENMGDQGVGIIPADVIFVVDEKPHHIYSRIGDDLVVKKEITLLESLVGTTLELLALDGRKIMVPLTDIVKPGQEVVVPNEGMPLLETRRKKGTLRVQIDVTYPERLSEELKSDLRTAFEGNLRREIKCFPFF